MQRARAYHERIGDEWRVMIKLTPVSSMTEVFVEFGRFASEKRARLAMNRLNGAFRKAYEITEEYSKELEHAILR